MGNRKKIIVILLAVLAILSIVGVGYYIYYSSQKTSKEREELQRQVDELKKETEQQKTTEETKKETTKTAAPCASTLTDADKIEIQLWKQYENSKYECSFKYPETWQVDPETKDDNVILKDNEALVTLWFKSGSATAVGYEGFTVTKEETVTVACESTQKTFLTGEPPGGENFRMIITKFTKNGTPHVVLMNYRYVGASISSDIVEAYDLILKTIEFK